MISVIITSPPKNDLFSCLGWCLALPREGKLLTVCAKAPNFRWWPPPNWTPFWWHVLGFTAATTTGNCEAGSPQTPLCRSARGREPMTLRVGALLIYIWLLSEALLFTQTYESKSIAVSWGSFCSDELRRSRTFSKGSALLFKRSPSPSIRKHCRYRFDIKSVICLKCAR